MTEDRTIHELRAEYGQVASGLLNDYHADLDAIREIRGPDEGGYLDQLTAEQRMTLLREQKVEKVQDVRTQTLDAAVAEHEQYEREVVKRRDVLKQRLFGVTNADAAARAATATESDLAAMLDYAALSGNEELAKAAFVAAHTRGAGDLLSRYFDEQDPAGRDLYAEWSEVPTEDALLRQRESIPEMVGDPGHEWLTPPARAGGAW
jgi:hypothetical protein